MKGLWASLWIVCWAGGTVTGRVIDLSTPKNNFEMPAMRTGSLSLPKFEVKDSKMPRQVERNLMMGMAGAKGGAPGPQPVIAPVQFPGILNPDIYIQNTQSAPVFPQVNAPPVSMNLHIDGLDKYYAKEPRVIHHMHHIPSKKSRLKSLLDA